jgi:hypothetical protein
VRRKILAVVVATAALAAGVGLSAAPFAGAQNGGEPVGGCPPGGGWRLVELGDTLPVDVGNFHDQNGDGFVCQRDNPGLSKRNGETTWTVKDNTNPLRAPTTTTVVSPPPPAPVP